MTTLHTMYQKKQQHTDDLRALIHLNGRYIGSSGPAKFYVLDGNVYCDLSHTQLDLSGDYFEFCDRLRNGQLPGFKAENGFHLNNNPKPY